MSMSIMRNDPKRIDVEYMKLIVLHLDHLTSSTIAMVCL